MNILLYILIFVMGTIFGSFFTLAIYRIPKRQDITHTHSYCPNCHHKLGVLDLIPIFSYICLLGKCRYCKEKIRPKYVVIEILSGFTFVIIAYLMNIHINNLQPILLTKGAFMTLYLCFIFIIVGIDAENRKIENQYLCMEYSYLFYI